MPIFSQLLYSNVNKPARTADSLRFACDFFGDVAQVPDRDFVTPDSILIHSNNVSSQERKDFTLSKSQNGYRK